MNLPVNSIICSDCLPIIKSWPDKSVKLIITSPPYNMGNKSISKLSKSTVGRKHYNNEVQDCLSDEQYKNFIFSAIKECLRISRYTFWNMQFLTNNKQCIIDLLYTFRNNLKDIFIWQKTAIAQISATKDYRNHRMATGFEFVFCFGEDNSRIFKNINFPDNGYVPNIQTWYKSEFFDNHHATFPLELPNYFIQYFSKSNDIILDPMCGSGTTCVAAKKLGRNYIGIDVSEEYCKLSRERIESADTGIPLEEKRNGQFGLF